MPPLYSFDPIPANFQWMDGREHKTRNTTKAGEQEEWFRNVFQPDDSPQNEEVEERVKTKPIKRKF